MKSKRVKSKAVTRPGRGVVAMVAAVGIAGLVGVGSAGCDTAARIGFPTRSFQKIETSGFTSRAGACMGVQDGEMAVRFVLLDNESNPIRLGDPINSPSGGTQSVELNAKSIALSNAALIEPTSGACGPGGATCSSTPFHFTCETAPGLGSGGEDLKSCLFADSSVAVDESTRSVEFVADLDHDQVYGVLMAATGSLKGWNLPGTTDAWDRNGNGQVGDVEDLPADQINMNAANATDGSQKRMQGLYSAYNSWVRAYTLARATKRKTYFGLWSFNEANIVTHIDRDGRLGTPWASDSTPIIAGLADYEGEQIRSSRANVYEAITSVINKSYSDEALGKLGIAEPSKVERQLVVFVDSPDDLRSPSNGVEAAIQAAQQHNVRLFILHLDAKLGQPGLVRENPRYWLEQAAACDSDADCKNFESCRKPRGYAAEPGQPLTGVPDDPAAKYCLIDRDERTGRTGPIHDYARLACETEGGYLYMPSADAIERNMQWTPYALDGLWEAKVTSGEMKRKASLDGAALKIHADMRITVAGEAHNYSFSQVGSTSGSLADTSVDALDTRSVVFGAP